MPQLGDTPFLHSPNRLAVSRPRPCGEGRRYSRGRPGPLPRSGVRQAVLHAAAPGRARPAGESCSLRISCCNASSAIWTRMSSVLGPVILAAHRTSLRATWPRRVDGTPEGSAPCTAEQGLPALPPLSRPLPHLETRRRMTRACVVATNANRFRVRLSCFPINCPFSPSSTDGSQGFTWPPADPRDHIAIRLSTLSGQASNPTGESGRSALQELSPNSSHDRSGKTSGPSQPRPTRMRQTPTERKREPTCPAWRRADCRHRGTALGQDPPTARG